MLTSLSLSQLASIAAILGFLLLIYQHKQGDLDTKREREDYINDRLAGRGWEEKPFAFEVSDILIEERSSFIYTLKRWALQPLEGSIVLTLKTRFTIDEELWESKVMDVFHEEVDTEVEYIDITESGNYVTLMLRIDSVEMEDVMPVVLKLTRILQILYDEGIANLSLR